MRDDLTLIIPTYRRPRRLARLLAFLARRGFAGRILIADSSPEPERAENAAIIATSPLSPVSCPFDPETPPFEKFALVAGMVETPFSVFCADDDVVLPAALPPILSALREDSSLKAAHGWYFGFRREGNAFDLERIVYAGPSIDAGAPLDRLERFLTDYESVTYAVHRAPALWEALSAMRAVDGLLFRELGSGALVALKGGVARLPVMYHGRSLEPSHSYSHWHPLDYLLRSPATLLRDYAVYRRVLMEACPELAESRASRLVDLLHLRYLADYLRPDTLSRVIEHVRAGTGIPEAFIDVGGTLPRAEGWVMGALRRTRFFQGLRRAAGEETRRRIFSIRGGLSRSGVVSGVTMSGAPRDYRLHRAFSNSLRSFPNRREAMRAVFEQLDAYE